MTYEQEAGRAACEGGMMLDLDAIEARAEYKLAHLDGQGISLRDITWTLQDVLNLLTELRAAREVVGAGRQPRAPTNDVEASARDGGVLPTSRCRGSSRDPR